MKRLKEKQKLHIQETKRQRQSVFVKIKLHSYPPTPQKEIVCAKVTKSLQKHVFCQRDKKTDSES